ncbi:MAG: dihydrodipicolinate synthase family protein, partial [Verrucomicrobia bacterium]|nr:dihydrodipicolinate synthase family protein [Verrucomicrobiota bacterium]
RDWLRLANEVTDSNAALFDAAHAFKGCIAGIQQVLFQQGLLSSPHCLLSGEVLSPGQLELLDTVRERYPQLVDDTFIEEHIESWMR